MIPTSKNIKNPRTSKSVNRETLGLDTQKEKTLDLNTQMGETLDNMEIDANGSTTKVGKSYSVPDFLSKVFTKELGNDGGHHHKLLVIAIHSVLLDSGFVAFDPVSKMLVNGFHLPDEWPSSLFMISLSYTLPEIFHKSRFDAIEIDTVLLKFQSLGNFLNVYGSLNNGTDTHWVCLDENLLFTFLNFVWKKCGSVGKTKTYCSIKTPEKEVLEFWRIVKDRVALPLLIDLCEKVGLDFPLCFMRLTTDLKLKILESLSGVDLAKLGCVCSELRCLTSNNDLWKRKFVEYFGNGEVSEGVSHWKEKFGKSLESQKRRKKMGISSSPQRRRNLHPSRVPPIIGGDYVCWPHFGPIVPYLQPGRTYQRDFMPLNEGRRGAYLEN